MNRRGFLSALGVLVTTATLPKVPAIPVGSLYNPTILKLAMNAMYGKTFHGGRYERYYGAGSVAVDIRSAYPLIYEKVKVLREQSDEQVYQAFHT